MKIFEWMQTKLNSRNCNKKPNSIPLNTANAEEFSDWPHALLAIGTFGNGSRSELRECWSTMSQDNPDQQQLTPEVLELQDDQGESNVDGTRTDTSNQAMDPYRNHLESEGKDNRSDGSHSEEGSATSVVPVTRGSDILADRHINSNAINKKSLSFLLKKMFVCSGGLSPSPSIRDHQQLPESKMEKILRAILHKKIYPQSPSSTQKYLENKHHVRLDDDKADSGSKWVKTDSEYIVLEI